MTYLIIAVVLGTIGAVPLLVLGGGKNAGTNVKIAAFFAGIFATIMWAVFYLSAAAFVGLLWGTASVCVVLCWFISAIVINLDDRMDVSGGPWVIFGIGACVIAAILIASTGLFRSAELASLIGNVETREWTTDVQPKDPRHIRLVSAENAVYRAGKELGSAGTIGSQFELVGARATLQILHGEQWYCIPLDFTGFFVWAQTEGVPAYILVSAEDPNKDPRLISLPEGKRMQYTPGAYFSKDVERHLRGLGYLTTGLVDYSFEVDEQDTPWWIVTTYEPTVGWGGDKATGIITVNPVTGEAIPYALDKVPSWVDRVIPEVYVTRYLRWTGKYIHGFWNTMFGSKDLTEPETPIFVFGAENQPLWVAGITSTNGGDDSLTSLVYVNARTGKAVRYHVAGGGTETAAVNAANHNNQVQFKKLRAVDPQLYNVDGSMTYVATLLSENHAFQGVALVSARNVQHVGIGDTITTALRSYEAVLSEAAQVTALSKEQKIELLMGVIDRIAAVQEGSTTAFYLHIPGTPHLFTAGAGISPKLAVSKVGDQVRIEYVSSKRDVVPMRAFDNLSLLLSETPDQQDVRERAAKPAPETVPLRK